MFTTDDFGRVLVTRSMPLMIFWFYFRAGAHAGWRAVLNCPPIHGGTERGSYKRRKMGTNGWGEMCGCGKTCRRPSFLRLEIACVYAGPSATTSRKPTSFHAQTHIDHYEYKLNVERLSREWRKGGVAK
jgi:hypothetical protein